MTQEEMEQKLDENAKTIEKLNEKIDNLSKNLEEKSKKEKYVDDYEFLGGIK